jgi:hypothetical protein
MRFLGVASRLSLLSRRSGFVGKGDLLSQTLRDFPLEEIASHLNTQKTNSGLAQG